MRSTTSELHSLAGELGIAGDRVFVGGVELKEPCPFTKRLDVYVNPSFNETFSLPILEGWRGGARSRFQIQLACRTAGGAALLFDPSDPDRWPGPSWKRSGRRVTGLRDEGLRRAGQFTWRSDGRAPSTCTASGRASAPRRK